MCGIFGVINFDGKPVDKEKVLSARDVLAHRGPDDSGIYFSNIGRGGGIGGNTVALAHRRLSIIDLSPAAHQPMTTEDGRYTIVYNGEIYNYREISKQLTVNSKQINSGNSLLTSHYSLFTTNYLLLNIELIASLPRP